MRMRAALYVSCAAGTLLSACAPATAPGGIDPEHDPTQVIMEVNNNHWNDVVIHVVRGGQRARLMRVSALNTRSTVLARLVLRPGEAFQVLALPAGGSQRYLSPLLHAQAGTTVSVTLETDLRRSSVAIW